MVVDDKLLLKQIWTCLCLPQMTVVWRPLVLAYDLVLHTIETKWRIVSPNHFLLGKSVLLSVKSSWTPKPLKCLSSIRAPSRFRFLCAAGGAFRKCTLLQLGHESTNVNSYPANVYPSLHHSHLKQYEETWMLSYYPRFQFYPCNMYVTSRSFVHSLIS